jgi:predicted secreted protein
MLKRFFAPAVFALALVGMNAWAGDAASFVDLGFSADGSRYMFAQYGVESNSLKPWADLFVVDVPKNDFVSGGRKSLVYDGPVIAGQDGSGAFYKLLAENADLAAKHKVDFLRQSQPLYLAMDNGAAEGQTTIEFRDFEAGASYTATLVPYIEGSGANLKSSFFIDLERTLKDGTKKRYTVGTPGLKRPLVSSYRIRRAVIAPKDGSLIFVVELRKAGVSGLDSRYMVEALRL